MVDHFQIALYCQHLQLHFSSIFFTATSESHHCPCFLICYQPPFFTVILDSLAIKREGLGSPHLDSVVAWRAGGLYCIDIIRCTNMFYLWQQAPYISLGLHILTMLCLFSYLILSPHYSPAGRICE